MSEAVITELMPEVSDNARPDGGQEVAVWPLVVIGNGPAGLQLVREYARLEAAASNPASKVLVYGAEPTQPYNRIQLSSLLNGDLKPSELITDWQRPPELTERLGCTVTRINREERWLEDSSGQRVHFRRLVLATGSRAHVPGIPGMDKSGVFSFRDYTDTEKLFCRRLRSRHTVVLGGGLLGLEAARCMVRHATRVTLIHHSPNLMNRQLNDAAAERLRRHVESLGVEVMVETAVTRVWGRGRVEGLELRFGRTLSCDTLVVATGIRPRVELAREAGIAVGQGIRVNDRLETSTAGIYAVGECAEYDGQIYGLVGPGLEQAGVLARHLCGDDEARYQGSVTVTRLKVTGLPVSSVGATAEPQLPPGHGLLSWSEGDCYRAVYTDHGRIIGAVGTGDWPGFSGVQALVENRARLMPLQRLRFRRSGELLRPGDGGLDAQPDSVLICNCRQITLGQLRQACAGGAGSVAGLGEVTGAGTVCGSCQPLLAELAAEPAAVKAGRWQHLAVAGLMTLLAVMLLPLLPAFAVPASVAEIGLSPWWTENRLRQWTGYATLGLAVAGLGFSLRKRIPALSAMGSFELWRGLHLLTALLALAMLVVHTGLNTGSNLNRLLYLNVLVLIALGGFAALFSAREILVPRPASKARKRLFSYLHLLAVWPLPVLLSFHVLTLYYFGGL